MQAVSISRVDRGIKIEWQDGKSSTFSAAYLRERCPCAVCREIPGRSPEGVIPLEESLKDNLDIQKAHPVGNYALQFVFTDQHDTGIYSFEMLRKFSN
ncbi:MAG: DUF971 domain-containing protein [Deltaproteobacteria bacterium]|nr:DUF971 domain-containing protein [Deltaproteobacteria bacterium]